VGIDLQRVLDKINLNRLAYFVVVVAVAVYVQIFTYTPYNFSGWGVFTLVVGDLLAFTLMGCAIFWRQHKGFTIRAFRVRRIIGFVAGAAVVVALAFNSQVLMAQVGPQNLNEEAAAVETSYTDQFEVEDCMFFGSDQTVTKRYDDAAQTCTVTLRIDLYSVVVYPDNFGIKLENIRSTTSADGKTLTLVFPEVGMVIFFLFNDRAADHAAPLSESGIDLSQPHFTALTTRWTA
jgi:hypothetical protein